MVKKIARSLLTGTVLNGASALAIKFAAAIAGFAMFALSSRYMEPAPFIDFDATDFFLASAGALAVALALQMWLVAPVIPPAVRHAEPQHDVNTWIPPSFKMWLSALLDTTGQYLEVVVIGFFLGPTAAALIVGCRRLVGIDPSLGFALASTHIAQLKEETP
ncbi:MAG TPA: hypothetical protein VKE26_07850 [Xanthobacteraceae bacterium]|nr:hypothetical protein [Xanthobacteraceae bacterium]